MKYLAYIGWKRLGLIWNINHDCSVENSEQFKCHLKMKGAGDMLKEISQNSSTDN